MRWKGMATILAARERVDGLRMKRALPLALVAGRRKRLTLRRAGVQPVRR